MAIATTKTLKKGVKIIDKETGKDLTGIIFTDKWQAAQYWHSTRRTHGQYTTYEIN